MTEKYCTQVEYIPEDENVAVINKIFMCKITGKECISAHTKLTDKNNLFPYDDKRAQACPAYDASDNLAKQIKKGKLIDQRDAIDGKIAELE